MGWTIRLCGPVGLDQDGQSRAAALPGRQGRLLFAYLVLNRDRDCGRAELIDLLWPERPPAAADSALSALLSKLRRALGEGALAGRSELRLVPPGPIDVDVEAAASAATDAEAAIDALDWAAAGAAAREVLATDLQTFLPDCDGPWVAECRRELETVRVRALEVLAEAGLRQGGRELGTAEQAARAAVAAMPFRESSHRLLMEVHEAADNPAEALRVFEELRVLLRDELGTTPGPAAMAVHERLLRGEAPAPRPAAGVEKITAVAWPAPLAAALGRHALVGRARELDVLEEYWDEAVSGTRELVLLAGDAGIGKTRLAAELGRRAHDDGALVLYGRFDEETIAPYQPVVEMVRGWSSGASLDPLRECLGSRAAELGILFSELGPPPADSAEGDRLRFFDAVAALLAEAGAQAPLVLVFDDLHWADRPTLQLLRHLVRAPQPPRALLLGTYREAELEPGHALHELIADVRRDGMLKHLALAGLAEAEVAELVSALGVPGAEPSFVHALHGETDGNPFFIEEVVRHMREGDRELSAGISLADAGVPDGVREVTARRLRRLDAESRQALQVAAVVGREFDYDVLQAVAPLEEDALISALEEGVEARVLREAGRVGRYAFTHALVRATLYDGLSQLRRARLHGRVGEAIARLRGADLDPHLPQLAYHFAQAAPVEQPERAIDFALAAARRADRQLAWEEAAQHYRAALRARELTGAFEDPVRAELLLAQGASEDRAGMEAAARTTFQSAAATARVLQDPSLLGRAALGHAGQWSVLGRVDEARLALLEEALEALGDDDSPLRARLLARLALELYYSGDPDRRLALSEQAVDLARRLGDPRTLATCLDARHYALWRPENVNERLEVAAELRRVAEETGDPELELEGAGWTVVDLLELGDVQGADIQIAAASKLAEALQRPIWLLVDGAAALHARAARRRLRRGRAPRRGGARDRPPRPGRERGQRVLAGDVQHPPRAGPAGGGRAVGAALHRPLPDAEGVAGRARAAPDRARARGRGAGRVRGAGRRRHAARRELADRRHAARRGLRRGGRRGAGGAALRAARALCGSQRRGRPCRDVQRRRFAAAGHAGRGDALVGAGRGALHQRAGDARADGRAAVGGPHPARLRRDAARAPPPRRQGPRARPARRRGADGRRARDGGRGAAGAGPRAGGVCGAGWRCGCSAVGGGRRTSTAAG